MIDFPSIPGYRIEKELGRGGMATVYLAVQERLNRRVAIKVLSPLLLQDQNFARRFLKEAETAANLAHPSIVTIFDVGDSGGNFHIIMEYLGESLKDKIIRHELDPEQAMKIVVQIAGALDYAHAKGFVHRDIKPENILFRADGMPVLVDFGIAKAMDAATKLTKTGISIGTPYYMSPEQGRGEVIDGRSDYYSLGVVLYEMLTGKVPYDAENTVGIVIKHIQEPIPTLPADLTEYQSLLGKMMSKAKPDRMSNSNEMANLVSVRFPLTEMKNRGADSEKLVTERKKEKLVRIVRIAADPPQQSDHDGNQSSNKTKEYHLKEACKQISIVRAVFIWGVLLFMLAIAIMQGI